MTLQAVRGFQPLFMRDLAEGAAYLRWLDALMELARTSPYNDYNQDMRILSKHHPVEEPTHVPQMKLPNPETGSYDFDDNDRAYTMYMAAALRRSQAKRSTERWGEEFPRGCLLFYQLKSCINTAASYLENIHETLAKDYRQRMMVHSQANLMRLLGHEVQDTHEPAPHFHRLGGRIFPSPAHQPLDSRDAVEPYLAVIKDYVAMMNDPQIASLGVAEAMAVFERIPEIYLKIYRAAEHVHAYADSPDDTVARHARLTGEATGRNAGYN